MRSRPWASLFDVGGSVPASPPASLQRRGTDRRVEAPEQSVVSGASNQPGPKAVSEEVELNVRIRAFALPVLAVNDLGFRRMHLQAALRQPCLKLRLESLSFLLVPAVNQPIVCIPTPRKVWVLRVIQRSNADSGDCGQGLRLNATMRSDRMRPPVPTKAAVVSLPA